MDNPTKKTSIKGFLGKLLFQLLKLLALIVIPFVSLVRGSVYFYVEFQLNGYLALLIGFVMTLAILMAYFVWIYGTMFGFKSLNKKKFKIKMIVASTLLIGYCSYTLFILSERNAKSSEVKSEFVSLHPLVRLGLGTILLADKSMIITDMSRVKEDYKKMGLNTLNNSLHYEQSDGYVHAVDLRTNDRSEFRNWLLKSYFWTMGFHTLRHVGTADHLHISLPIHENPDAL